MNWLSYAIDYGIIGLLLLMSFAAVALAVERYLTYRQVEVRTYVDRKELELLLSSRLHLLATIGSNAPYIGLLGTVLGIMLTFQTMGRSGFMDTGKIMVGLAMALKVTAAGLLVAIPTIVVYNLLQRRRQVLLTQWEIQHGRQNL
ncbi:MAG TPA: TonB-system energizer ExbB [Desulfurivibrionaceae bacterium]|nr:TonB-system energizer ExbB [Desulfurivibrionaceae bacterium]